MQTLNDAELIFVSFFDSHRGHMVSTIKLDVRLKLIATQLNKLVEMTTRVVELTHIRKTTLDPIART